MPDGAAPPVAPATIVAPRLSVGGFEAFTTTDFPDKLAAVIFCQGCPWSCGYCHNPHLIAARGDDEREFERILAWLVTRRGLLDAVVFSGGEPTAQPDLSAAIDAVRALGFAVGLHTGGAYPRRLAQVLPKLDWIGVDVKASVSHYAKVTGVRGSGISAFESLDLVRSAGIAYEVRTTALPRLTAPDEMERLARELAARGVMRWVLQPFRPTGCTNETLVAAAPAGIVLDGALLTRLAAHVPNIAVRA